MKKRYENPELDVQIFTVEDVITTSGDEYNDDLGEGGLPVAP